MNKKILLILIILSFFAVSNVNAADTSNIIASENSTNIETPVMDEILEVDDSDTYFINTGSNIQDTIDQAKAGDTIILNGTFELKNTINIDKTINIIGEGEGATIKPNPLNFKDIQFFNIKNNAHNVVLSNLKLINGKTSEGLINWEGNTGSIDHCKFAQNKAETSSGAILLKGNDCKITDCTFKSNEAQIAGAMLIKGDNCHIVNCTFNENSAYQYGGAILIESDNCIINNCTFSNNFASQSGGAIVLKGKKNIISNSEFDLNYLRNYGKESIEGGGAIFSNGTNTEIDNCIFNRNTATDLNGGAINLNEYGFIQNSFFKDNSALLGRSIYCSASAVIASNYFVIKFYESEEDTVKIIGKAYTDDNIFNRTKEPSSVDFSASMIFEYGSSGSIYVIVDGGIVKKENIRVLEHKEAKIAFSKNRLTISGLGVGNYILRVTTTPDSNHTAVDKDLNITVKKAVATISASKMTVALKSSTTWSIKIINSKTHKPISNMKLNLKVYTGKNYEKITVKTNSKGVASYKTKSLKAGTHTIIVTGANSGYKFNTLKSSIKVIKQTQLNFKQLFKTSDADGAILSYIVSNKKTNKGINGIKIKVLIYTGKKYKTYILKTKKVIGKTQTYPGAIGFSTNDFSAGKHKVKLIPYDLKYKGSGASYITIKKSATKGPKFFRVI